MFLTDQKDAYWEKLCSEMDCTPEKSFSNSYKNSRLLLTVAAALSQKKRSDNSKAKVLKALKMHFRDPSQ